MLPGILEMWEIQCSSHGCQGSVTLLFAPLRYFIRLLQQIEYHIHICIGLHNNTMLHVAPFVFRYIDEDARRILYLVTVGDENIEFGL